MVHLHVHTKYSLLDATIKIEELAEKLKAIGQNAIAITDHGNLYGAVEAYKVLSDNGIKTITGCEMYICDDVNIQNKDSKYYHLILLCKNNQGRLNLNHLVTESCNYKYYGKPRIDFSMLEKYHDGLICSSACMAGEISRAISDNDVDTARQIAKKYRNLFGEDFYIEYQSHENEEQQKLNAKLIQLANELNIKYYVTCDAHYLNKEDQKYHSVFVRIGSMREAGETYDDCYIQSEQEILEKCYLTTKYNEEAIRVTEEIAAKCENTIPLSAPILPHVPIPEQFSTEEDYFKYLCNKGFKEKGFADWNLDQWKQYYTETVEIDGEQVTRQLAEFTSAKEIRDRYIDRCRYEMNAIVKMGFVGYYLLVHSYVTCVNRRGIARGSGGGSLLAYLSGIVDIDPIKYGLYFERFVDVGALSLLENGQITKKELKIPDFDTDFAPSERDIAVEFVSKRYGSENFVAIGQFGYIKAKGAIKDIGKVLGIPFEVTNTMTKTLDNETTIQDALDLGLLDAYKSDYPELFVYASHLAGLPKSFGVHPCGKIICMNPAVTYNAVEYNENKNEMVLQGDMHTADDLGLVKCDFLGLRTLDVIYDVLDMIGKDYDYIAPHKINTSDKLVWNEFAEGHTDCIFQFESPGMKRMLKDMKCDNIENLSAANALYRPGSKDYIPNYVGRKNGTEEITYLHPDLEPILSNSYGIIVFQEQLIEIGRLAGLSNPDELRKATAKKKPKLMAKIEPELKGGLMNRGWTQQQVDDLWTTILQFAKYSFNKCVSGDTIFIKLGQKKSVRNPTVEQMYNIMNSESYAKENNFLPLRKKYLKNGYPSALSMFDDGRIHKNKIINISESGVREIFRVKTEDGFYVDCTMNHKFPTPYGEKKLSDLHEGDLLYTMGQYEHTKKTYNFTDGNFESNIPHKGERGFQEKPDGNSVKFHRYRSDNILNYKPCEICGKHYSPDERFELHHKHKNRYDNNESNLVWCCNSCHKRLDYAHDRNKVFEKGLPTVLKKIVSIEYLRTDKTYDVTMSDPAHNFVVNNGLVVSNSHSSAYALTAYISMYMKVHHTGEFFAACINSYEGDIKGIVKSIQEGKRMGVSFQFRNWRNINAITEYNDGVVWLGINTIKGFGSSVANALHCISEKCRTFTDFLVLSGQQSDITYAQIDTLITHNFFSEFGEVSKLLNIHKLFDLVYFRKVFTKGDNLPISEEIIKQYSKETKKQYRDIRSKELFEYLCETIETPKFPIVALLNAELEDFGYINYTNPKAKNFYYITNIDTTYSPKLSLYDMCDGVEISAKVSKKMFKNNPLCVGQIIKAIITPKPKVKKTDDGWEEIPDQFDNWLQTYIVKM